MALLLTLVKPSQSEIDMTTTQFDEMIGNLNSARPLKVERVGGKEIASLMWKKQDGAWEHLMSVPNGSIYKKRHDDYGVQIGESFVAHQSLRGVYNKLVTQGFIKPYEKSKFL